MAGRQTEQLDIKETESASTFRASSPLADGDTPHVPSSQDQESSTTAAPLYPDLPAQVSEPVLTLSSLPNIEEVIQDGLALQQNFKRQYEELQERAKDLEKAKARSADHKAELDLERQAIEA